MFLIIQEGEVEALAVVHSYEDGMPAGSHKTRLTALNVWLMPVWSIIWLHLSPC